MPTQHNDINEDLPFLTVSKAARLANMHSQTLRQYDRLGLVVPHRTGGGGRRYSLRDVRKLLEVQRLSQVDGVNLIGIKRILFLEEENYVLRQQLKAKSPGSIFTTSCSGEINIDTSSPLIVKLAKERTQSRMRLKNGVVIPYIPAHKGELVVRSQIRKYFV